MVETMKGAKDVSEVDAPDGRREMVAGLIGAAMARLVYGRNGDLWVSMSQWTTEGNIKVGVFEGERRAGMIFKLDELKDARDILGTINCNVAKLIELLEADIKKRAELS